MSVGAFLFLTLTLAHTHTDLHTLSHIAISQTLTLLSTLWVQLCFSNILITFYQCRWHKEREREITKNRKAYNCVFCISVKVAIGLHRFLSIPLWFSTSQINGRLQPFSSVSHSSFYFFLFVSHWNIPFFFLLALSFCFWPLSHFLSLFLLYIS